MERKTTYTVHTQPPCSNTHTVVVERQQQPRVHHVHHRHHRHHYYYGGGLLGAMARAVTDDLYGPHYVVTEEKTQPVAPVHTTVQVTTPTPRSSSLRQNVPPTRPVPPRPVPSHLAALPQYKATDCFKLGNILELQSKLSGDRLMLDSDGALNCNGDGGPACQFKVRSSGRPGVYKLQNVAQPRCYLGYSKGYIIGHGKGDRECDFIVSMVQEYYVTLECCQHLGNVLGSLPSGDITDPSQTTKNSDVAQFAPHIIST